MTFRPSNDLLPIERPFREMLDIYAVRLQKVLLIAGAGASLIVIFALMRSGLTYLILAAVSPIVIALCVSLLRSSLLAYMRDDFYADPGYDQAMYYEMAPRSMETEEEAAVRMLDIREEIEERRREIAQAVDDIQAKLRPSELAKAAARAKAEADVAADLASMVEAQLLLLCAERIESLANTFSLDKELSNRPPLQKQEWLEERDELVRDTIRFAHLIRMAADLRSKNVFGRSAAPPTVPKTHDER